MKILSSAIQALLCFSVLGSSAVWGNKDVNDEIVTTRSSERGDAAFNHRNLRLGDGSDGNTIINGEPLDPARYPYLVHIDMGCGGTLVAKDVVLTASHCIFDPIPDSAYVTIGRTDLTSTDGEEIKVKKMIRHPDYSGAPDHDYDYALLVLERATTQDIKLITLNSDENFPAPGSVARIMGWGATDAYGTVYPDTPSEADVNVISKAECAASAHNNHTIEDFHICTFEQSKAFCNGDSGGPLIILGASPEQDVQVGIVSFSEPNCTITWPDVFARVSNQLGWIKKNVCCESKSETTFDCSETTFDCSKKSAKAAKKSKKM